MKWMIISDIHGSINDLRKVIDIFEEEHMDHIILLGDLLYHGPRNTIPDGYNPKAVANLLNQYKDKIICSVRGNCDSEVDQMLLEFPILSTYSQIYVDNHRFFLTHGHIYNEDNLPLLNKGDVLMYGHFHKPIAKLKDDIYIFNPNSITFPKEGEKSYGVYEKESLTIYNVNKEIIKQISLK